jgi:hypothetical protein
MPRSGMRNAVKNRSFLSQTTPLLSLCLLTGFTACSGHREFRKKAGS